MVQIRHMTPGSVVGGGGRTRELKLGSGQMKVANKTKSPLLLQNNRFKGDLVLVRPGGKGSLDINRLHGSKQIKNPQTSTTKTVTTVKSTAPQQKPSTPNKPDVMLKLVDSMKVEVQKHATTVAGLEKRLATEDLSKGERADLKVEIAIAQSEGGAVARAKLEELNNAITTLEKKLKGGNLSKTDEKDAKDMLEVAKNGRRELTASTVFLQFSGLADKLGPGSKIDVSKLNENFEALKKSGAMLPKEMEHVVKKLGQALDILDKGNSSPKLEKAINEILSGLYKAEPNPKGSPEHVAFRDALIDVANMAQGKLAMNRVVERVVAFQEQGRVSGGQPDPVGYLKALESLAGRHTEGTDGNLQLSRTAMLIDDATDLVSTGHVPLDLFGGSSTLDKQLEVGLQGSAIKSADKHFLLKKMNEAEQKVLDNNKPKARGELVEEIKAARIKAGKEGVESIKKGNVAHRDVAVATVEMRIELTRLNKLLARNLASTSSGVSIFSPGSELSMIRKDDKFFKVLQDNFPPKAVKDVAFLIGRIAVLEKKVIEQEHDFLGMHKSREKSGKFSVEGTFDPKNPLSHVGITDKDLNKMGVSETEKQQFANELSDLSSRGLRSVDDVARTTKLLQQATNDLMRNTLTQEAMQSRYREDAGLNGDYLLGNMMEDAFVQGKQLSDPKFDRKNVPDDIGIDNADVAKHFKGRMDGHMKKLGSTPTEQKTKLTEFTTDSIKLDHAKRDMIKSLKEFRDVENKMDSMRQRIRDAQAPNNPSGVVLSDKIDLSDPAGLRSAKSILSANDAQGKIDTLAKKYGFDAKKDTLDAALLKIAINHPDRKELETQFAARDKALGELKGFDPEVMHRTVAKRITGAKTDIDTALKLKDFAEAIVYLREGGPQELETKSKAFNDFGKTFEDMAVSHREKFPDLVKDVEHMTRMVVLAEWQQARVGGKGDEFDATNPVVRGRIEKQLTNWGVDPAVFRVEIDSVLFGTLNPTEMERWRSEAVLSQEQTAAMKTGQRGFFSLSNITNLGEMSSREKDMLQIDIKSLKSGERLDLKGGNKITLSSGKLAVEPTGTVGITAKISGMRTTRFEIEHTGDGYVLTVGKGTDIDGAVGVTAGKKVFDNKTVNIGVEGSLEVKGGGGLEKSVAQKWPATEQGLKDMLGLVEKMVNGDKITMQDWKGSTEVTQTNDKKGRLGVQATGNVKAEVGKKVNDDDKLGVGASLEVTAFFNAEKTWSTSKNLNRTVETRNVGYQAGVGAGVSLYAKIYNPLNMIGKQISDKTGFQDATDKHFGKDEDGESNVTVASNTTDMELIGASKEGTTSFTTSWKRETDNRGQFTSGEFVKQTSSSSGKWGVLANVMDAGLQDRMVKEPEFRKTVEEFMGRKGSGDIVSVSYEIKPNMLNRANDLMRRSENLKTSDPTASKRLRDEAVSIMENEANYAPKRFEITSSEEHKSDKTNLNVIFVKWETSGSTSKSRVMHQLVFE